SEAFRSEDNSTDPRVSALAEKPDGLLFLYFSARLSSPSSLAAAGGSEPPEEPMMQEEWGNWVLVMARSGCDPTDNPHTSLHRLKSRRALAWKRFSGWWAGRFRLWMLSRISFGSTQGWSLEYSIRSGPTKSWPKRITAGSALTESR